jgi:hypothetical protein
LSDTAEATRWSVAAAPPPESPSLTQSAIWEVLSDRKRSVGCVGATTAHARIVVILSGPGYVATHQEAL